MSGAKTKADKKAAAALAAEANRQTPAYLQGLKKKDKARQQAASAQAEAASAQTRALEAKERKRARLREAADKAHEASAEARAKKEQERERKRAEAEAARQNVPAYLQTPRRGLTEVERERFNVRAEEAKALKILGRRGGFGVPAPVQPGERPRVALIADVPGWAFDRNLQDAVAHLSDRMDAQILYVADQDRWPPLDNFHVVYLCHRWWFDVHKQVPWDRAKGSLRSAWLDPDGPKPVDIAWVERFRRYHVVTRDAYARWLPVMGDRLTYLTNPVNTDLFKEGPDHGEVIACWAGNTDHGLGSDLKGIHTVIRPACEAAGVPLRQAEFNDSRLPPEDMPEFYRGSTAVLCASEYEGAPNFVMEAMACGLLVIATAVGNVPEMRQSMIDNLGDTGIFIVPREAAAMESALKRIQEMSPERREDLASMNATEIRRRWSWGAWADRYADFLLGDVLPQERAEVVNVVVATHRPEWGRWPDTDDRDLAAVMDEPPVDRTMTYRGREFIVREHLYPVYEAFLALDLPLDRHYSELNNMRPLPAEISQRHVEQLRRFADERGCKVLWWEHAHLCRPQSIHGVKDVFPLKTLHFGDDAPGSSESKTFPVCDGFDALYYTMLVWDFDRGLLTADQYTDRGLDHPFFVPSTRSAGLDEWCHEHAFDINAKVRAIRAGSLQDTVWVGAMGGCQWRKDLLRALGKREPAWRASLGPLRLHGSNMLHGVAEPYEAGAGMGRACAAVYEDGLFGFNLQHSSIYNTRLRDLWVMGVCQIIHDRHDELATIGAVPWVHYVPFNGGLDDLWRVVDELRQDRERLADIIEAAWHFERGLEAEWSPKAVRAKIFTQYADEVVDAG